MSDSDSNSPRGKLDSSEDSDDEAAIRSLKESYAISRMQSKSNNSQKNLPTLIPEKYHLKQSTPFPEYKQYSFKKRNELKKMPLFGSNSIIKSQKLEKFEVEKKQIFASLKRNQEPKQYFETIFPPIEPVIIL